MIVMWQTISVSKEAFSLLSMSRMAAVGMDIESQNFIFMFSLRAARQEITPGPTFRKKE